MPGPRNMKKKKQAQVKKARLSQNHESELLHDRGEQPCPNSATREPESTIMPPLPIIPLSAVQRPVIPDRHYIQDTHGETRLPDSLDDSDSPSSSDVEHDDALSEPIPSIFTKTPFIHDPGNGPRVRDMRAFLASSFAARPSFDDPLCAEFAHEEMIEMLSTVLPEETALILWYNRSRKAARVCPACQRLYRLGDALPEILNFDEHNVQPSADTASASSILLREQELSGLCSPVCFVLAALNYPGAIHSTWGQNEEEIDDDTWDLLDGPSANAARNDMGLGMLLKMTRCTDLALGELFFPDEDLDDRLDGELDHKGLNEEQEVDESEDEDYGEVLEIGERVVPPVKDDPTDDKGLCRRMQILDVCA